MLSLYTGMILTTDTTESMKFSPIVHLEEKQQLQLLINDKDTAWISYVERGELWYLTHSEVPSPLRGKGVGKILVEKSLEYLEEKGIKYTAVCPFIKSVVQAKRS